MNVAVILDRYLNVDLWHKVHSKLETAGRLSGNCGSDANIISNELWDMVIEEKGEEFAQFVLDRFQEDATHELFNRIHAWCCGRSSVVPCRCPRSKAS